MFLYGYYFFVFTLLKYNGSNYSIEMKSNKYTEKADTYHHSSFYEKLVEHVFIAEIVSSAWFNNKLQIEIARAEIDNSGYDLIMECNGIIRHVQLKTSDADAHTRYQKVNIKLGEKPSGCVVWIKRNTKNGNKPFKMEFLFYGDENCGKLPSIDNMPWARHTKGDSKGKKNLRLHIKKLKKGDFTPVKSIEDLIGLLFNIKESRLQNQP